LLKPCQVLGTPIRTTGQAPSALALCKVVTLNKTGVHLLTHWRGCPARHHGLWRAKYHVRAHCHPSALWRVSSRLAHTINLGAAYGMVWERRHAHLVIWAGTMRRTSSARRACTRATDHWE